MSNKNYRMNRYKVSDVLKMLREDGWYLHGQKGSHRQFKHPSKKGKVTVNGKPGDTITNLKTNGEDKSNDRMGRG